MALRFIAFIIIIYCHLPTLMAQTPLDGQVFIIQSAAPGAQARVLDANGLTLGRNGTEVQLWSNDLAHNNVNQKWKFVSAGQGANVYRIMSLSPYAGPYKYLDADGRNLGNDGGNLQLWKDNEGGGLTNQMWHVVLKPNGTYRITSAIPAAGGRVLDADGNTQGRDGGKIQLWSSINNNANQEWNLLPAAPAFMSVNLNNERQSYFSAHGGKHKFSADYQFLLESVLTATESVRRKDFAAADMILRGVWQRFPLGGQAWTDLEAEGNRRNAKTGTPPMYAATRMLTDIVRVHRETEGRTPTKTIDVSVILVGKSTGKVPANKQQVIDGEGTTTNNTLMPRVRADNYSIVRKSLDIFNEYFYAVTEGQARVNLNFVELPDYSLPISYSHSLNDSNQDVFRIGGNWVSPVSQLTAARRQSTDLYIVIYPSLNADNLPFKVSSTGGQSRAEWTPLIVFDDKFMLNPANIQDLSVRLYMPQFYQHELFHYLFSLYPELGLEASSHQWFDPKKWPTGLSKVATREPDYYHEALFKKMRTQKLSITNWLTSTSIPGAASISMDDLLGNYVTKNKLDYGSQKMHFKAELTKKDNKYFWTYTQPAGAAVFEVVKKPDTGVIDIVSSTASWAETGPGFRVYPANNPVTGKNLALDLRGLLFYKK